MKRFVVALGALSSVAIVAGSAVAADMPVKAAPPAPAAPVYNWTGFYVGGNVGYGWDSRDVNYSANDPAATVLYGVGGQPPATSFKTQGVLGGLQLGYNYQFSSNWLVGVEADFDWSDINGSGTSSTALFVPLTASVDEHIKWFGTVRARLGYLPTPNLLAYATGGFAYGKVEHTGNYVSTGAFAFAVTVAPYSVNCVGPGICFAGSSSRVTTGWTLGGGLEYAAWQNWSLKVEYLYVSLNSEAMTETALATFLTTAPASFNANFSDTNFSIVRAGLNYRF